MFFFFFQAIMNSNMELTNFVTGWMDLLMIIKCSTVIESVASLKQIKFFAFSGGIVVILVIDA